MSLIACRHVKDEDLWRVFLIHRQRNRAKTMISQCVRLIRRRCFTRQTLTGMCFLLVAAGGVLFYANRLIVNASQHLTWNAIQAVPAREVGLVLGAKPGNRYFIRRINTAAALYHAGKVKWLLVSGDNGQKEYDEPSAMQQALIAKGVPEAAIFCDYAGFSTLDSVVRARKVFGENRITIISQAFHNQLGDLVSATIWH